MANVPMYNPPAVWNGTPIHSWGDFHDVVKTPGRNLLAQLDDFGDCVLVAGCQRSGTAALARLFRSSRSIVDHTFAHSAELDGAVLLAGQATRALGGRHCFQTTYLNDRYVEYFAHEDFRLIWMLREPRSVVYSMLHHWKRAALTRLYDACGAHSVAPPADTGALRRLWLGPSRLFQACASYIGKTAQTAALRKGLGERLAIVDYDELVARKTTLLPQLCEFARVRYTPALAASFEADTTQRSVPLRGKEAAHVEELCVDIYERARALRTIGA